MCDTVYTSVDGVGWFGKNSDREAAEAQSVEVVEGRTGLGGHLRCTWRAVPQVGSTRTTLLSRPAWMWGAEMGANDAGVVIGNEAVFTRIPVERDGLTGMDLLRLALERAGSAEEAVDVVIELLGRHPQGGGMGFRDRSFRYHSSFLIADPLGAFVLETAGPYWAVERVRGTRTLSNRLSIGVPDRVHPDAADVARRSGWWKRGEFEFAAAFADPLYSWASGAAIRAACTARAMTAVADAPGLLRVLRDHGDLTHPRQGWRMRSPCAHASWLPTRKAGQTTASLASRLAPEGVRHWATGTSAPCLSVFKPVGLDRTPIAPASESPDGSLWWRHERLHRAVLADWPTRSAVVTGLRDELERTALSAARFDWEVHRERIVAWTESIGA